MKKVCFTVILCFALIHLSNAQSSERLDELLQILREWPTTPASVTHVIENNFSEMDQKILFDHFESRISNQSRTPWTGGGEMTYLEVQENASLGHIPIGGPYQLPIGIDVNEFICADDYDETGTLYVLDFDSAIFGTIDPITGMAAPITWTGIDNAEFVTGLAHDPTDGQIYIISAEQTVIPPLLTYVTRLYTVDVLSGEVTLLGDPMVGLAGIWLEIDNNGVAYMADILMNALWRLNLDTQTPTMIQQYEMDLNFAQEAAIDPLTDKLYMSSVYYDFTLGNNLFEVDKQNGELTFLYHYEYPSQFGMLSIPYYEPLSVPISNEDIVSIYPNPTSTLINLSIPQDFKLMSVSIYDSTGRLITITNQQSIDVSELSDGVYIMNVLSPTGIYTKKFIKN